MWLAGPSGSTVLLVGPCDGGKTTLFHQLLEGSTHLGTVASMQANVAEGVLASEKVRLVGENAAWAQCWQGAERGRTRRQGQLAPPDRLRTCPRVQAADGAAKKPFQLVDIPGHPRVRGQMDRHADRAAGVVFVVDSVDFMPRKTEAAE